MDRLRSYYNLLGCHILPCLVIILDSPMEELGLVLFSLEANEEEVLSVRVVTYPKQLVY